MLVLLKYVYYTYNQESIDKEYRNERQKHVDYRLLKTEWHRSLKENAKILFKRLNEEGVYEIDIDSVEDMTI